MTRARALTLPMAFALVAGFRPPALPRLGAAPLALSPTTRCLIMPCMKSGKRAGGRALSNGPTEARALQSSPGKFRRLLSASRHRLLPVLIPAVVFATTVSRFAPAPVTQVQVQRSVLKKAAPLPSDNLDALAHLTYSVRYPISTRDLAHVKRDFLGADPSASAIKAGLDSISRKEALYSVAQSGKWTYPGWRSDLALALDGEVGEHGSFWLTTSSAGFFTGHGPRRSTDDTPSGTLAKATAMDTKQAVHERLPPRGLSSTWTSLTSSAVRYLSYEGLYALYFGSAAASCVSGTLRYAASQADSKRSALNRLGQISVVFLVGFLSTKFEVVLAAFLFVPIFLAPVLVLSWFWYFLGKLLFER